MLCYTLGQRRVTKSSKMNKRVFIIIVILASIFGFTGLMIYLVGDSTVAVLEPAGMVATQQRDLLYFATALSMVVVIPVFILTTYIAVKYRASNASATYAPGFDSSRRLELLWWGLPIVIIIILSVITWRTSHALDPYRPLESTKTPLTVQVVALEWKWLFIYPEQGIATVNRLYIPEDTPINFKITADAPMNSLWIPQLGGMVYAMSGMETKLHLIAEKPGEYRGVSSNISGEGFADMNFQTIALSESDFATWLTEARNTPTALTHAEYVELAEPSTKHPITTYGSVGSNLYASIIESYMSHGDYDHAQHDNIDTNEKSEERREE